jgi:hypothetical protein
MMVSTKDLGIRKALPDFLNCILRLCYEAKCDGALPPFFILKIIDNRRVPVGFHFVPMIPDGYHGYPSGITKKRETKLCLCPRSMAFTE